MSSTSYVFNPIPIPLTSREAAALRIAQALAEQGAARFDTPIVATNAAASTRATASVNRRRPADTRSTFLRVVHEVVDETTVKTEATRQDLVPYREVGDVVEHGLRRAVVRAGAATALRRQEEPLACWLTLTLSDGCILQHAFFVLPAAGQDAGVGPLEFTTALSAGWDGNGTTPSPAATRAVPRDGGKGGNAVAPVAEEETAPHAQQPHDTPQFLHGGVANSDGEEEEADNDSAPACAPSPVEGAGSRPATLAGHPSPSTGSSTAGGSTREGSGEVLSMPLDAMLSTPAPLPPPPAASAGRWASPAAGQDAWHDGGAPFADALPHTKRPSPSPAPSPPSPPKASAPDPLANRRRPRQAPVPSPQPPVPQPPPARDVWPPPPPPLQPSAVRRPTGNAEEDGDRSPSARPQQRRGWPSARADLCSPSAQRPQASGSAQRRVGSRYREELWRLGQAAMTTYDGPPSSAGSSSLLH